ncbi:MAG: ABC transporter ATP-binding protein [Elusimicrobiales bacterium]
MTAHNFAVKAAGVRKSFGRKSVLRGVDFEIEPGRVAGLLGLNGQGKTTLIKILLGITAADEGCAEVSGVEADSGGKVRLAAGYIPERPAFQPFMTAGEIFAFRSRFYPTWNHEKAAALARRLGLDLNLRAGKASKGETAKIAWVCAAAHNPDVLILDEPASGLDALAREQLLCRLIEELSSEGKTILVASHRLEDMAGILDDILLLSGGRIAGIYDAHGLSASARRITGRARQGAQMPQSPLLVPLESELPLLAFAALDDAAIKAVHESGVLENAQEEPLGFAKILAALLSLGGNGSGLSVKGEIL